MLSLAFIASSFRVTENNLLFETVRPTASLLNILTALKGSLSVVYLFVHYANMPMQYTAIFHGCKNYNFQMKNVIFFLFWLKTDRGYTLEPPQ